MKHLITAATILLSITLSACLPAADDPKTVADKYWQQIQAGNLKEAEKLTLQKNQQILAQHSNHIMSDSQVQNQSASAVVSTTITTTNPTTNQVHRQSFDTVLVLNQGKWVVDLEETEVAPLPTTTEQELQELTDNLNDSMEENLESLDKAIEQGMHEFNDALRDGSQEMGDSLLQMMNKLNRSMKESIEKLKRNREQQLQEQPQPAKPDPRKGEGKI